MQKSQKLFLTVCAKAEYEGAVLGEYFDVVVVEIGDDDVAMRVCSDIVGPGKLGTLRSASTKLCQHLHREFGFSLGWINVQPSENHLSRSRMQNKDCGALVVDDNDFSGVGDCDTLWAQKLVSAQLLEDLDLD